MSGKSLINSLKKLVRKLRRNDIDYVLVGGLAVSAVSEPRSTVDIDLLVGVCENEIGGFITMLEGWRLFVHVNREPLIFRNVKFIRGVLNSSPEIIVDFLIADDDFKKNALKRGEEIEMGDFEVEVAAPEDLIILKLLSMREHDILDIKSIISHQKKLDRKYLNEKIAMLGIEIPPSIKEIMA